MPKIIPAGTKIHVVLETGFAGSEERGNYITCQDYDERYLNEICQNMAEDNADSYGIENANYMTDEELDRAEESGVEFSYDINGYWEYYNNKEHSGYFFDSREEFIEI